MDLKDFVKETLVQIVSGVKDAQPEIRNKGGFVNPSMPWGQSGESSSHFGNFDHRHPVFLVDFDVAVTVSEESETGAEAKLKVASLLSLGAGGESSKLNQSTSKISFKVPVAMPLDQESESIMQRKENNMQRAVDDYNSDDNGW